MEGVDLDAAIARAEGWLQRMRNDDSSWGYGAGQPGRLEPTVLCAAAGLPLASGWLAAQPREWAMLLLPAVAWDIDRALCEPIVDWIIGIDAHSMSREHFDGTIPGWGWRIGTASWVEPTVYALLSLVRADRGPERIANARAILVDRQCHDGGWNYGNPRMLASELEGQLGPTGWAVMALEPGDRADRGLRFLEQALLRPTTLSLSIAILARRAQGLSAKPYAVALVEALGDNGWGGRIDLTALAVAALRALQGPHAFRS